MNRLTPDNLKTVGYDTWELCGLDHECKRDCWKPTPCKIPKIIYLLGQYEDTGLTPEEIMAAADRRHNCKIECLLEEYNKVVAERDTLKKALELMATYLVHFGRLDEMLCDDIPQPLHLKYQPKNDGEYENEPCIKCVQEFYIQQAQEEKDNAK